ncbi:MAG TPA: 23S rRNA (guanosine(2251)-2'-O)-methyltransferase RlmB [Gammaproteobacteria bacterium]|nr:23S rRNA (guanosine(2251)-2'-O)-methyltransferase RlmB [Gammaproteobacteria bacterium]
MTGDEGTLLFGIHAVAAALRERPAAVRELCLAAPARNPRLQRLRQAAEAAGVTIRQVPRETLDALAGGLRHQGVMARLDENCRERGESGLERLLDSLAESPLLLVLDGVQDPHNLGACLRSAEAAGAHAVIVPRDRAAGLTPVARKVACGAAERLPFIQVTNLARTLRRLRDRGLWIVGAAGDAPRSLYDTDLRGPLVLVLGAEGRGLRRLTREHCDFLVAIPMAAGAESLNVSVAAGVCLFEARRQRVGRQD